ncbi:hypothetical protein ABTX15_10080 [Micromonospora sp. NPDC094482]|uniref:hypothetical protein n=1 Tax=unclassified Micromonospora TaxID=2617518 RepID=UPI00332D3128
MLPVGQGVRRLELTGATLSSGWSSAGSRDGNPVYQQVRVFEVANPGRCGWAWVARRAGRGRSSTDEPAERDAGRVELELPVARRRRKRPVERHLDP